MISVLQVDQEQHRRKNDELARTLREKTRKQLQTQELYDKLKRKSMLGQVQNAAIDAVDETIHASVGPNRYSDVGAVNNDLSPPHPPQFVTQQYLNQDLASGLGNSMSMAPPPPIQERRISADTWIGPGKNQHLRK